jgi:hypothetical protein
MKRTLYVLVRLGAVVSATVIAFVSFPATEIMAAPGMGLLFGTDGNGGNLVIIDLASGVGIFVGPMRIGPAPALAADPGTGIMYAGGGGGLPNLYRVDPSSGATTLVGNTGLGFAAIGGMDFSSDGTLYAAVNIIGDGGTGSDHLAIINAVTGAARVIGPFGICGPANCTLEGMEGIAFDQFGTLWGALSERGAAGAPGLYIIDPVTGAATFVTSILNASGRPPSGGIVSLQFACDGTLYGGTARALSPTIDGGGRLVTINPGTGLFEYVGKETATAPMSLAALAFLGLSCR